MRPALTLSLCVLVLVGCRGDSTDVDVGEDGALRTGRAEATAVENRAVAVDGRDLVLDGFAGDLSIEVDPAATEATLVFTRRARGATDRSAEGRLEEVRLEEAGDDEIYQYVWRSGLDEGTSVDVSAVIPKGTSLVVRLGAGEVALTGQDGTLDLEVGAGALALRGLAAATVRAEIGGGEIVAEAGRVPTDADWRFESGAGRVVVGLPRQASVRVEGETGAGDVAVQDLQFDRQRLSGQVGRRFSGQLGAGAGRIRVSTGAGEIVFRRADVENGNADASQRAGE